MAIHQPPKAPERLAPGTIIVGKYRVERVVGRGGMGQVVLATHLALHERVAIKLLLPEAMASEEIVASFRREALASVRLRSEHVCRVFDVGETEDAVPFIVMEYLEGRDLSSVLREKTKGGQRGLAVREAITYVMQAAEGLAEAHALGIVHRDVKPANLFRAKRADGTPCVKVLDFGIAKTEGAQHPHTQVMGSVHYMSPEQAQRGRSVDARSDVWSLSAVLYQLLAGVSPFEREVMHETIAAIVADEPSPLTTFRDDLPAGLAEVVARGLCKDREARFLSMADLADALGTFAGAAGARQALRVRAVYEERRRTSLAPEAIEPVGLATPTRFDLATQTIVRAAPSPPGLRGQGFGSAALAFAILCLAGGVVYSARMRLPAANGIVLESNDGRTELAGPREDAAAASPAAIVPSAAPSSGVPVIAASGAAPVSSLAGAAVPLPVAAVVSLARTSAAPKALGSDRALVSSRIPTASATSPATSALRPPAATPGKAASPCRDILTDEPIPCH